jgi:glycerol-3-phosphate dehydrogenase
LIIGGFMQITVVGAGNMGLAMVGYMAVHCKGYIILFTGKNIIDKVKIHLHD